MKKKASLFTLLVGLISLSGCYHYAPKSADYNGKTYKNGWYQCFAKNGRDLYPIGLKYDENKAPLFNKEKYNFWFTDQFSFDLLYAEYEDSQFWHPDVYVFKEELKDAQKFYQDKGNYDYFIGHRFEEESELPVTDQNEIDTLETVIEEIMKDKKSKPTVTFKEDPSVHNLTCFRRSKDGLFMTIREQLVVHKETVYYLKEYDGSKDTWTYYDLGEVGKTLYSMFSNYHLL